MATDAIHIVPARQSLFKKLWPLGPIFNKELREMARRKRSYGLRVCYLGLLLSVLGLTWLVMSDDYRYRETSLVMQAQRQAEMGKIFFTVFSLFSIAAMHLIGPVLTSTAIGSERLRRTFDVLLMTPISAWQLVGGKLFSRLLTAFTLLGLTLPVLAIVRLLGGVELEDMFGALVLAATVAMSSAALGLLLSCWIKRAWAVILLAYIIQGLIYALLPILIAVVMAQLVYSRGNTNYWVFEWLTAANPLMTATLKIESPRGMFSVSWWVTSFIQVVLTFILTLLSAIIVRRIGRRDVSDGGATTLPIAALAPTGDASAPPVLPYAKPTTKPAKPTRAVGDHPVLWRELRRPLLPKRWMRIVATLLTVGLLFMSYLCFSLERGILNDRDTHTGYAITMHTLLLLMSVVLSATAIATEKESDTWTLLIVTPVSGQQVMWAKFVGVLRRLFWPWTIVVLHMGIFTLTGAVSIWSTLIVLWTTITFNLLWIATGLYYSLRFNRVTTAVVANLMSPILVYGLAPLILAAMQYGLPGMRRTEIVEIPLYWLPYYYIGVGIDRLSRSNYYAYGGSSDRLTTLPASSLDPDYMFTNSFWIPFTHANWPIFYLLPMTFIAGAVMLILALLIVWWCGFRFDKLVKRSPSPQMT